VTDVLVVGGIFREVIRRGDGAATSRIGGSGYTAVIAAARLGARTSLLGAVGADDADQALEALAEAGVDTAGVAVLPGSSGIFVFDDVADVASPRPIYRPAEAWPDGPAAPPPAATVKLAFGVPEFDPVTDTWLGTLEDGTLLWDRQGWLSRSRDSLDAARRAERRKVHLANIAEARDELAGQTGGELARSLPPPGFDAAVLKAGPWGVTAIDADGRHPVGAFPVRAIAAIGSGDVFAGATAAGLAAGLDLTAAARRGSAAAAVALVAGGAHGVTRLAVDAMLDAGEERYVDPDRLGELRVRVERHDAADKLAARQIEQSVRHLGLRVTSHTDADIVVRLRDTHSTAPVSADAVVLTLAGNRAAADAVGVLREALIAQVRERLGESTGGEASRKSVPG
jgi:ribokinase